MKPLADKMAEQAALYEFTNRLCRATSAEEIYTAALDAILRALGSDRASILLFNDSGVMSFEARRGIVRALSGCRQGHSPWTPECRDALYPGWQALTLTAPILRAFWALTVVRLTETGVTSPPAHYC